MYAELEPIIKGLEHKNRFAQFVIVYGERGGGKHEIVKALCNHLALPMRVYENTVEGARLAQQMVETTGQSQICVFYDTDNMRQEAFSILLKTTEEVENKCYIIITCSSLEKIPATIINRGYTIKQPYYEREVLCGYARNMFGIEDFEILNFVLSIAHTPGQIREINAFKSIKEFKDYVELTAKEIDKVDIVNAMKMPSKLSMDAGSKGFATDLFLRGLFVSLLKMGGDRNCRKALAVDKALRDIMFGRININLIMDNLVIDLRSI